MVCELIETYDVNPDELDSVIHHGLLFLFIKYTAFLYRKALLQSMLLLVVIILTLS